MFTTGRDNAYERELVACFQKPCRKKASQRTGVTLAVLGILGASAPLAAQPSPTDIEIPVLIATFDGSADDAVDEDEIDLANVVLTAAKGVTTIQEAPAIVTVLTEQDLRDRGIQRLDDAIDIVPGWLRIDAIFGQFPYGLTRGITQSMLYMQNGVSLFDPALNIPSLGRMVPIETVKRVEIVTGPGGVLWGANSYMGVVNVVTKDGTDVDGVEADIRFGGGDGNRNMLRGYVMAGMPALFDNDDVSLMVHTSFDTYQGPKLNLPQHLFSAPIPQPNSLVVYGPLSSSDQPQSSVFQVNSKLVVGDLEVIVHAPLHVERHLPAGFLGAVTEQTIPDDSARDPDTGQLLCAPVPARLPDGQRNPAAFDNSDGCVDRARLARDNRLDMFERYAMAQYRHSGDDGSGLTVRGYFTQFVRSFPQLSLIAPSRLLEGGLSIVADTNAYRSGVNLDGQLPFGRYARVLYGAEVFREWLPGNTQGSRQGDGVEAHFQGPGDLNQLALACPRQPVPGSVDQIQLVPDCPLTFIFSTDRTVLGAYVNPQIRYNKLIIDAGVRAQGAPSPLSLRDYPLQFILSGAAVYNFAPGWHAKLNYAEGFRPPVFNNTDSNGEGIQIEGSPDLDIETSQSVQAEVNARLFRGKRALREVSFRADYSYTRLENLIFVVNGFYENSGDRGIHSAEFLGKIHLAGNHRVELGYTFLRVDAADRGVSRNVPEHWFNFGGVFSLIPERLQMMTNFKVLGAMEDPNRMVEYRPMNELGGQIAVDPTELTLDRLPPSGELNAGLAWLDPFGIDRLRVRAFVYNAFNTRHYNPDTFGDYEPRLETQPNPYPDFRFMANLNYRY